MIRWLAIAAVAFILYKLVVNEFVHRAAKKNKTEGSAGQKMPTGEMVKDPICGSYVDVSSSVSVRDGVEVHRFCSYECRDAFLEKLRATGRKIPEKIGDDTESV